jgi:hypothetical protein
MTSTPPADKVPPVEPAPSVAAAAPATPPPPPPPYVDPYAQVTPPPPPAPAYVPAGYSAPGDAPAYQAGYYATPQPPRGLAVAALITGIAGAFFSFAYGLGLLPSIAGIITGHLARKRQPHAGGMALAGLICGYFGLAISILWIIGIILFIVFVAANPSYNSDF